LQKWDGLYRLAIVLTANKDKSDSALEIAIANAKTSLQIGWNSSIKSVYKAISKSVKILEKYKQKI